MPTKQSTLQKRTDSDTNYSNQKIRKKQFARRVDFSFFSINILFLFSHRIAPLNANMVREKSESIEDGADEKMLGGDDKQQLARKDEVKFIAIDRSNGDAKCDIGQIEKVRDNYPSNRNYAG